jgi:hypothetical protein
VLIQTGFLCLYPVRILHIQNNNISIDLSIEAGFYKDIKGILNYTNLCEFESLTYLGQSDDDLVRSQACPLRRGPYQLYISFTLPDFVENDPEGIAFTPDLQLYFNQNTSGADIGCVQTGTLAMLSEAKRNGRRGQRFMMFSIIALALVLAVYFVDHGRRRKAGEAASKQRSKLRRFHYRRDNAVLMATINPASSEISSADPLREVT